MNYFMLPQLYNEDCENNINIIYNGPEQSSINLSLNIYLNDIKKQIDILEKTGEWNIFKKYTNQRVYQFALRHRDVIKRFGRFPHRNKILDRVSSQKEIKFLEEPGSSF